MSGHEVGGCPPSWPTVEGARSWLLCRVDCRWCYCLKELISSSTHDRLLSLTPGIVLLPEQTSPTAIGSAGLNAERATPAAIGSALRLALTERSLRAATQRVAEEIKEMDPPTRVIDKLNRQFALRKSLVANEKPTVCLPLMRRYTSFGDGGVEIGSRPCRGERLDFARRLSNFRKIKRKELGSLVVFIVS
jgi:hypothetical protein